MKERVGTEGTRRTPVAVGERAVPVRRSVGLLALPQTLGTWLTALMLFVLALVPRTVGVGRFLTVDEAYHWLDRTDAFVKALRAGKYINTFQTGHPGVTVMWLGSAGVWLHERLARAGLVAAKDAQVHVQLLRLPLGITSALCIALAFPLMRRLFGARVALLAAILWATEPFIVAHAQLLHLDATLTSLITLTLLLALVAFGFDAPAAAAAPTVRWHYLFGAACTTGLALLTKSPSLILVPMVGLIALVGLWRAWPTNDQRSARGSAHALVVVRPWFLVLGRFMLPLAFVGVVALVVWFALWPALWVDLVGTVEKVLRQAEVEGGSPHAWGNFFWGKTVVDPGPLFYLVAVPFRLTPWASAGVLLFALFGGQQLLAWLRARRAAFLHPASRIPHPASRILLLVFVLVFTLMMTLSPKKFDRYVLPIFPSLMILAAIGWMAFYDWLRPRLTSTVQNHRVIVSSCHLVIVALALVNLWWFHPYELAYFNQLLGGGPVAERTVPIGWGEVYEQAGAYIMTQPDGRDYPVAVRYGPLLEPYIDVPAVPLNWAAEPGKAGYAILYIDETQRSNIPPEVARALGAMQPLHTVQVHGIDYAHIYQLPQPAATPRPADFGAALHLRGYDLDAAAVRSSGALTLTLHWQPTAPLPADYTLFVHVLDARGEKIGGADLAPGRAGRPTSAWQPEHYVSATYTIPVRSDAPPGTYWVAVGLYDPHTGARLPLRAAPLPNAPDDGGDALLLGTIAIPR